MQALFETSPLPGRPPRGPATIAALRWPIALAALLVLLAIAAAPSPAGAQPLPGLGAGDSGEEAAPPEEVGPPDPADLAALARLLADDRVRQWLAEQAAAQAADDDPATAEPAIFRNWLHHALDRVRDKGQQILDGARALPDEAHRAGSIWALEMGDAGTLRVLLYALAFLAVGILLEQGFWRATRRVRLRIVGAPRSSFGQRLQLVGLRIVFSLMSIGAFALGTLGTFLIFDWQPITELLILTLLYAFVLVRLAGIVSRLFLAPRVPNLRLLPVGDRAARLLHGWLIALTATAAFGFLTCIAIFRMGLLMQSHALLISAVGFAMAAMVVAMIWQTRTDMSALIAGHGASVSGAAAAARVRGVLAELWPFVASAATVIVWALWSVGATRIMGTLVIGLAVPLLLLAVHRAVEAAADGEAPRPSPYLPAIQRFARVVLVLLLVAALAHVWGVDLVALMHSMAPTARIVRAALSIGITLLVADFVWQLIRASIDRRLEDAGGAPDPHGGPTDGEGGGAADPHARVRTLLPLIRKTIAVVLAVMVAMILLSSIGVNIGPLLAGAGVVGIAVGFGAQALVRDIVSGVFFLIDDAFRLGEYIEIGELRGTVEGISIRSLKLRHHRGAVQTIPFGEVRNMTNYSRDWVIMKLEFRVPFETDLSLVKRLVKQIGKELLGDPTLGPSFIEPLKSQGVRRWEEFNMVVGVKFMAKPGQQFLIRKEAYQRIRDVFEANGIHFAQRHVTVQVAKDATPEDMEDALTAATQDYVDGTPTTEAKPQPA